MGANQANRDVEQTSTTSTDTAVSSEADSQDTTHLQNLFVDVCGTAEVVEYQDPESQERSVANDPEAAVTGDVAQVVADDGLEDTLPELYTLDGG